MFSAHPAIGRQLDSETCSLFQVVCRELGFGGQSMFLEASRNPDMAVSLRGMDCLGDEESVMECFRLPWSNSSGSEVRKI